MAYGSLSSKKKKGSALKGLFETPAPPKPKKKNLKKIGGLNDREQKRILAIVKQIQREKADKKHRDFMKSLMNK